MQITEKIDPTFVPRICFFCPANVDFMLNESIKEEGIKFKCPNCKLIYTIKEEAYGN